ncbi:MAG: hypothetical protein OHK0039_09050 [Bacteroidia bacterium]
MSSDSFEKNIQQQLAQARLTPPPAVWEALATQLDRERSRRRILWLWWDGLSLLLPLTLLALYLRPAAAPLAPVVSPPRIAAHQPVTQLPPSPQPAATPGPPAQTPAPVGQPPRQLASGAAVLAMAAPREPQQMQATRDALPHLAIVVARAASLPAAPTPPADRPADADTPPALLLHEPMSRWRLRVTGAAGQSHAQGWPWQQDMLPYDRRIIDRRNLTGAGGATQESYALSFPRMQYQAAIQAERQIARRWYLGTGLQADLLAGGTLRRGILPDIDPGGPVPLDDQTIAYGPAARFRQASLSLPLYALYDHRRGPWAVEVFGGPVLTWQHTWHWTQGADPQSEQLMPRLPQGPTLVTANGTTLLVQRRWYGSVQGGVSLGYDLAPRVQVRTGPMAQYLLSAPYGGLAAQDQPRYRLSWQVSFVWR